MTTAIENLDVRPSWFSFESIKAACVSLIFISSFFVKFEPAPSDLFSFIALLLFARTGLYMARSFAVPLFFIVVYMVAYLVSATVIDRPELPTDPQNPLFYWVITAYMTAAAVLIAGYVAADPLKRFMQITRAWWIGATIGSVIGLLIYFGFKPLLTIVSSIGSAPALGYVNRVIGAYKDPNVFSTWLVFPIVSMIQALALGRLRLNLISISALSINVLALLLALSRGAWFDLAAASILTLALTTLLTPSLRQRQNVMLLGIAGIFLVAILLVVLLSVPSISAAFTERFVLVKSYDSGENGRFGHQLNAIPILLGLPLGLGPYQFQTIFGDAPHNAFLNSFAGGGWLAGISYIMWFLTTTYMGIKTVFTRSPFQAFAIPVTCTYIIMTAQGFQIDNEHWRHLFWMMGLIWGLFATTELHRSKAQNLNLILEGWNLKPNVE